MYAMFVVVRLYVIVFDFASELLLAVVNSDEEVSMSFLLCCMFVLSRRSISNFPTQEQRVISPSYTLFCCCLSVLSRIVRAHCKLIFVEVRRVVYFLLAVFVAARFRQKNVVLRAYVFIRALGRELTRFFVTYDKPLDKEVGWSVTNSRNASGYFSNAFREKKIFRKVVSYKRER